VSTVDEDELIAQIAQDYYLNRVTLGGIAAKYSLSRYKIAKYLEEGLRRGVVQIRIRSHFERNAEFERVLRDEFGIPQVAVLRYGNAALTRQSDLRDDFRSFAAQQVQLILEHSRIVGIAWGDTLDAVLGELDYRPRPEMIFTQFVGRYGKYHSQADSTRMVQKAAAKYDAEYLTLDCPTYILDDRARDLMRRELFLQRTLDVADRMDTVLTGIGTFDSLSSVNVWNEQRHQLFPVPPEDVAGFVYGRPYDVRGTFLSPATDKTFGVGLDRLLQVPRRIGLVETRHKGLAALGALRSGAFTDLIMTEPVADAILQTARG
jgi:DNA-binding transcriptional regulator LsrR (DeoR family)